MENARIKELFLTYNTNYPFPSNELYLFFGFNRHNNFIRVLNKDEYQNDITIKPWIKVNARKSDVYFISRNLFYLLCQRYISNYSEIEKIYLDYKSGTLKSKILYFENHTKKTYIYNPDVHSYIKGHYYTYSLDTLNIAKDLDIDVYDLFKFCSLEFCSNNYYSHVKFKNYNISRFNEEFYYHGSAHPYYSFDNINHEERYLFIGFLKTIKLKFKLTDFQHKLIDIYTEIISRMIAIQLDYDIKEKRRNQNKKVNSFIRNPKLTAAQESEMKTMFRKAAMYCHPDKDLKGEEIFKDLNNANRNKDYWRVKEIFESLNKPFHS